MNIIIHRAEVFGEDCEMKLMEFSSSDAEKWRELFRMWKNLKLGLKEYKARGTNFPEGLSEVAFCLYSGSKKFVKKIRGGASASFDTFNVENNRAEQIKASSINSDLSSFGPKSKWDDLYFLDFYNNGRLDGRFNLYKIPTEEVYRVKVNSEQTFRDQQLEGRRPRFSITKEFINLGLEPIESNIQI